MVRHRILAGVAAVALTARANWLHILRQFFFEFFELALNVTWSSLFHCGFPLLFDGKCLDTCLNTCQGKMLTTINDLEDEFLVSLACRCSERHLHCLRRWHYRIVEVIYDLAIPAVSQYVVGVLVCRAVSHDRLKGVTAPINGAAHQRLKRNFCGV